MLAEMREHCPFDIYTYVAIVTDWCCNTELRQEYYDRIIREYGENIAPETFFTALKVELSHVMQTDSRDFSFAVKILREIERRGYTIHRSVFDKLENAAHTIRTPISARNMHRSETSGNSCCSTCCATLLTIRYL